MLRGYDGWETWECPACGSQIGYGPGGRSCSVPRCTLGHPPAEMEQKFASAMPTELLDRAVNNPDIRARRNEGTDR